MNKEELIKEYDEKAKALRDEFISKLEDDKKEFKVELPNKYDTLYFIDDISSKVYMTGFSTSKNEIARYLRGYFFETKEEAEQHLKECKLLFKLHQYAKEKMKVGNQIGKIIAKVNIIYIIQIKKKNLIQEICFGRMNFLKYLTLSLEK